MNYAEVTDYIFSLRRFGEIKLGLERVQYILDRLGNPEKRLKVIHVGGTAGKGSTVAIVSSILKEAGYRVGTYTSPHLASYTERVMIGGERIPENEVVRLFTILKPIIEEMQKQGESSAPTFAEVTTALALYHFAERAVDFAVVEVMMGGRLDATNVVHPLVSVITNIGLEHTEYLGNTIEEIAAEKAGIIKPHTLLVTAAGDRACKVFEKACRQREAKLLRLGKDFKVKVTSTGIAGQSFVFEGFGERMELFTPLIGSHQAENAALAIAALLSLKEKGVEISLLGILEGLRNVRWPGRMEVVQKEPLIILDCAKDVLASARLAEAIEEIVKPIKLVLVISTSADKKHKQMMADLAPIADYIIAARHSVMGRALDPQLIADEARALGKPCEVVEDIKLAVMKAAAKAGREGTVLVTGSVFTVGEARDIWFPEKPVWGREMNETRGRK